MKTLDDFVQQVRSLERQEVEVRSWTEAAQRVAPESESLRAEVADLRGEVASLRQQLAARVARVLDPAPVSSPAVHNELYLQLVGRIREGVAACVPRGATVAVISKGDEKLLDLGGRPAWHLPQTPQGVYAGHHPADSTAAIAQLESLRAKGARYLVIPSTAFWWLDHYQEFSKHLESRYRRARNDKDCAVYDLGPAPAEEALARQDQYRQTLRRVREVVGEVVPAGAIVAVVSKGDANLVAFDGLGGRHGWHFPQDQHGAYAGHHPADGHDAVLRLDAVRAKGARYLLLPNTAFWWLDYYEPFARCLESVHRRVFEDKTCRVYELAEWPAKVGAEPEPQTSVSPATEPARVVPSAGRPSRGGQGTFAAKAAGERRTPRPPRAGKTRPKAPAGANVGRVKKVEPEKIDPAQASSAAAKGQTVGQPAPSAANPRIGSRRDPPLKSVAHSKPVGKRGGSERRS